MATITRVSVQEFLALQESKPYRELMDGEVIEKALPNATHALLTSRFIFLLTLFQQRVNTFHVMNELRQIDAERDWVYLPDISVILKTRLRGAASMFGSPVAVVPDFAIEVLSPDDRSGMITRRIAHYQQACVALLWIVDPESETITSWMPGSDGVIADPTVPLSAAPVLPGFELNIPALFAVLHEE